MASLEALPEIASSISPPATRRQTNRLQDRGRGDRLERLDRDEVAA